MLKKANNIPLSDTILRTKVTFSDFTSFANILAYKFVIPMKPINSLAEFTVKIRVDGVVKN